MELFSRHRAVHCIGVKGIGLSALAQILKLQGHSVTGSDVTDSFPADNALRKAGIRVHHGFTKRHLSARADLVVVSNAYLPKNLKSKAQISNPEIREALRRGIPILSYPEAVAALFNSKRGIAVAGSHGKSTTTALLGVTLEALGRDPAVLTGAVVKSWNTNARIPKNSNQGGQIPNSNFFVLEADEYRRAFLHYTPLGAIVTSIDWDHPDVFASKRIYQKAFESFISRIQPQGFLVACGDDPSVRAAVHRRGPRRTLFYGFDRKNTLRARSFQQTPRGLLLKATLRGRPLGTFTTKLYGRQNALNMLAAIGTCLFLGEKPIAIKKAIKTFTGIKRRFEILIPQPSSENFLIVDDYAHHPTEIRATLAAARASFPRRHLVALFQPHTFSRTKQYFEQFREALQQADEVALLTTYASARERGGGQSSQDLARSLGARHFTTPDAAAAFFMKRLEKGDLFLTLGAGNVHLVGEKIIKNKLRELGRNAKIKRRPLMRTRIFLLFLSLLVAPLTFAASDGADTSPSDSPTITLPPGVTSATTYADSGLPKIYPRGVWEGYAYSANSGWQPSENLRTLLTWLPQPDNKPPDYFPIERIVVHDQGCLNPAACTVRAEQYPIQTIQGVYTSHAVSRGWGDIGYNYIIDRQGRIYEGRYGGNSVRAAHIYASARCENLNIGTAGILLLGDLRAGPMTSAQSDSLARLSAWLGVTNGFDSSEENVTTITWRNLKSASGGCDLSQGGFTGSLTGPRLATHGDFEAGNSDFFSLATQRQAAALLRSTWSSFVYRIKDSTKNFAIRSGALQEDASAIQVAILDQSQLEMFPRATTSILTNGTLVKTRTRPRVYVIENGMRRSIPSADLFESQGYRWDAIQEVTDRDLSLWRMGTPLPYPDGTLVRGSAEDIYVFEGGTLHHITSAALFETLRYSWTKIRRLFDADIDQYAKGDPKRFPDGTLVKSSAPRVYLIENGRRRAVLSADLFAVLKLRWTDMKVLDDRELNRYAEGNALAWPDGTLLRAKDDSKVYLIQAGYRRWIQTGETFRALGYTWAAVRLVSLQEVFSLPEATPIATASDRDGTAQPIAPPVLAGEPTIRIGLAPIGGGSDKHPGTQVELSYNVPATVMQGGVAIAMLGANEHYSFTPAASDIWRIEPSSSVSPTTSLATIYSYTDTAWNGSPDNVFRGVIELKAATAGTPWVINELKIEDYLRGIAETVNGDPTEYSKAFSIAARTYAYYYVLKGGKRSAEPFHLRRTSDDQLYKGYNFELRATNPPAAAASTRGKVALFNGKPIIAAYSSGGPGATKSACDAISQAFCNNPDFAYLAGGVADPVSTQYSSDRICGINGNHCAGMDAQGAREMAKLGSTGEQILTAYYPGISISNQW